MPGFQIQSAVEKLASVFFLRCFLLLSTVLSVLSLFPPSPSSFVHLCFVECTSSPSDQLLQGKASGPRTKGA